MKDLDDPDFGKDNKIFTREQAIAAMNRLRERLRWIEEEKEIQQERREAGNNRAE